MAEDGDDDVAAQTVNAWPISEESAVVPPALVCTIVIEKLFILVQLESDPGRLRVSIPVVLCEDGCGRLLPLVDIEPTGRLGDQESKDANDTGEQTLKPGGQAPRVVSTNVEGASGSTGGNDGAGEPESVVHGTDYTTEGGVVELDDVHGPGSSSDRDTKAEKETATHELTLSSVSLRSTLDDCTDDDDEGANEHADSPTPGVNGGSDKGKGNDAANLVHGSDDTSPSTGRLDVVLFLEELVLEK